MFLFTKKNFILCAHQRYQQMNEFPNIQSHIIKTASNGKENYENI